MTTATPTPEHHPAIRDEAPSPVLQAPEFMVGFLGIRTRVEFELGMMPGYRPAAEPRMVTPKRPGFNEEYFEWVDIFESVKEASEDFVMVELGAGYGRWLVRAAAAARRRGGCRFHGVGVEAEPSHFRWMCQHLRDNDVDPRDLELIWAAVGDSPGFVPFWVGNADGWYGQAVAEQAPAPPPDVRARRMLRARSALGRPPALAPNGQSITWVPRITLDDVLAPYARIDLMDLDLQGVELDVVSSVIEIIDAKVRRMHIGTHSAAIETGLRDVFRERGWENANDYACQSRASTPYGEIDFGDGVQTWLNPKLAPDRVRSRAATREPRRSRPTAAAAMASIQTAAAAKAALNNAVKNAVNTVSADARGPEEAGQTPQARIEELEARNRALEEKHELLRAKFHAVREKYRHAKTQSADVKKS